MTNVGLGEMLAHWPADGADMGDIGFLSNIGQTLRGRGLTPREARDAIVREAAPAVSRLVARDLSRNPRARRMVVQAYLTSADPKREYREVAAYDYSVALQRAYPEEFSTVWVPEGMEEDIEDVQEGAALVGLSAHLSEFDEEEGPAFLGLGISKKLKKRVKRIGKYVAIGAAVAGAVALTVATAGAAAPALASAAGTAFQMSQARKKAKAEQKALAQAEAEIAAMAEPPPAPDPGQIAPAMDSATQAAAAQQAQQYQQAAAAGQPAAAAQYAQQAGAVQAQGVIVDDVAPQAMASYAAQQVAGKTPEQVEREFGVSREEIKEERIEKAELVAAGAEPPKETPGWVAPAAVAGGGLLVALATGILGMEDWPWTTAEPTW